VWSNILEAVGHAWDLVIMAFQKIFTESAFQPILAIALVGLAVGLVATVISVLKS